MGTSSTFQTDQTVSIVVAMVDRAHRTFVARLARECAPNASLRFAGSSRAFAELVNAQRPQIVLASVEPLGTQIVGASIPLGIPCIAIDPRRSRAALVLEVRDVLRRSASAAPRAAPTPTPASPMPVLVPPAPAAPPVGSPRKAPGPTTQRLPLPARSPGPSNRVVGTPSASAPAAVQPEVGTTLGGRYVLEERLGSGGTGTVWAARHAHLGKRVALKLATAVSSSEEAKQGFLAEARIASAISHPNVVSVIDFGTDPELGAFIVMELLVGSTLVPLAGKLSIRRVCETLGQIADALDVLHRRGIVHGDVKAENVVMVQEQVGTRKRSVARLIDFGLSHRPAITVESEALWGTPEYLAPERILGGPATMASDIYALGVLAFELLTGRLPFHGTTREVLLAQVQAAPPQLVSSTEQAFDPALEALVQRAVHKEPAQRHSSAAAFRYELNTVMTMLGLNRRPIRAAGDGVFEAIFTQSRIAQAIVTAAGRVELANPAFLETFPDFTALIAEQPALAEAIAGARPEPVTWPTQAIRSERTLLLLITPAAIDDGVHVIVTEVRPASPSAQGAGNVI
jgi:hypothetical protein